MEIFLLIIAALLIIAFLGVWLFDKFFTHVTIYDHEFALLYKKGTFEKELKPGSYILVNHEQDVFRDDKRLQTMILPGQEILTKDNINIKISLMAVWALEDFKKARDVSVSYYSDFYTNFQMVARQAAEAYTLDDILEHREKIAEDVINLLKPEAEKFGIRIESIGVRDIMLSAQLKKAYAGIIEARKNAEKDLEVTRGEQAVMRKLANFSKIIDDNPNLMALRTLQTFSDSENVTVILGQGDLNTLPQKKK